MIYKKELDVKYNVDVFVAGGGSAGIAAAVAAARCGMKVFLAEARGAFGGAITLGLVPSIGPYYDGKQIIVKGIGYEIRRKISQDVPETEAWTPFEVEELKIAFDNIVAESTVDYSFFTNVCDVVVEGDKVDYVVLSSKKGLFAVKAKIYIDCTGDGDLCALGGGRYEMGDENGDVMPPTLCSLWANVDFSKRELPDDRRIEDAINDGVFTFPDRHLPGMIAVNPENGVGGGNIGHVFDVNPVDEKSLTRAMMWGRRSLAEYKEYFQKYLAGYEDMTLVYTADMLGVRESRRILCDYMLSLDDFVKRASFEDEIGRYCYAVDLHTKSTDKEAYERFLQEYEKDYRYAPGESYGVPYRSLIPVSFSNVLVAGRCIGADRYMLASIRVVPGCFLTGQAAGTAAALAVRTENVREISVKELQEKLTEDGAL